MENTAKNKAQENMLNGVDTAALAEVIEAVSEKPELGLFRFRSKNRWLDGAVNETECKGYYGTCEEIDTRQQAFKFMADEPPVLLGTDSGANPAEFLLTALSSCLNTSLIYHAAANGVEILESGSSMEGDIDLNGFLGIDPNVRNGYQEIRVKMKVKSDADAAKLKELASTSVILDTIRNPVSVKLEIEKA